MRIKNKKSLIKSIRKYNLGVLSSRQHGFMRSDYTIILANCNSGTKGGYYRNLREATISFAEAASLFTQGILIDHPNRKHAKDS
jgi:hypothetical protein